MTKAELLSKLDEKALRNIAKNEKLAVPKSYAKRDLVKYLEGILTLQKIKEYTTEVYEKETKRTIIHETIKEKGIRIKQKEKTTIQFDKLKVISEILDSREKIEPLVLEEMANMLKEPPPSGKEMNLYGKMSEEMLKKIHAIFIDKESDGNGLYLEFRTANFIKRKIRETNKLRIRFRPCLEVKQLDVIGFDSENTPLVMAECKDTGVKIDHLDKWIENTRRLFDYSKGELEQSWFVTSSKLTDECLNHIVTHKSIDNKRGQLKVISGITGIIKQNLNDNKGIFESGKVFLSIYEIRQNQLIKIFPK